MQPHKTAKKLAEWMVNTGIYLCFCNVWMLHVSKMVLLLLFCGLFCLYFIVPQLQHNSPAFPNHCVLTFSSAQVCLKHLILFLLCVENTILLIPPGSALECKNDLKRKWFRNCFLLFITALRNSQHIGKDNFYVSRMLRTHLPKNTWVQGWVYVMHNLSFSSYTSCNGHLNLSHFDTPLNIPLNHSIE